MNSPHNTSITIPLTQGQVAIIGSEDADLANFKWCALKTGRSYYAIRRVSSGVKNKQDTLYLHRVILSRKLGRELNPGEFTDHKDGDGLNNHRSNLRLATRSQNSRNSKKRISAKSSRYKGVTRSRSGWKAFLFDDFANKTITLGRFASEEIAGAAYNQAIKIRDGEFASYNDISGWEDMALTPATSVVRAKSGYRYVYYSKWAKRWAADINGRHLGYFDTPEKANEAILALKEDSTEVLSWRKAVIKREWDL